MAAAGSVGVAAGAPGTHAIHATMDAATRRRTVKVLLGNGSGLVPTILRACERAGYTRMPTDTPLPDDRARMLDDRTCGKPRSAAKVTRIPRRLGDFFSGVTMMTHA